MRPAVLFLLVSSAGFVAEAAGLEDGLLPTVEGKSWKLVWHDEFDGQTLDESKWDVPEGPRRDGWWSRKAISLDGKGGSAMHVYQRNINIQVKKADHRTLDIEAWMLDLGHLLRTLIRIDTESRFITHTEAEMVRHPFPSCPDILEKFHNLRGVKVERGISKKIKEIVGTRAGCVHLMELAIESMKRPGC